MFRQSTNSERKSIDIRKMDSIINMIDMRSIVEERAKSDERMADLKKVLGPINIHLLAYQVQRRNLISRGVDLKKYDYAVAQSTEVFDSLTPSRYPLDYTEQLIYQGCYDEFEKIDKETRREVAI